MQLFCCQLKLYAVFSWNSISLWSHILCSVAIIEAVGLNIIVENLSEDPAVVNRPVNSLGHQVGRKILQRSSSHLRHPGYGPGCQRTGSVPMQPWLLKTAIILGSQFKITERWKDYWQEFVGWYWCTSSFLYNVFWWGSRWIQPLCLQWFTNRIIARFALSLQRLLAGQSLRSSTKNNKTCVAVKFGTLSWLTFHITQVYSWIKLIAQSFQYSVFWKLPTLDGFLQLPPNFAKLVQKADLFIWNSDALSKQYHFDFYSKLWTSYRILTDVVSWHVQWGWQHELLRFKKSFHMTLFPVFRRQSCFAKDDRLAPGTGNIWSQRWAFPTSALKSDWQVALHQAQPAPSATAGMLTVSTHPLMSWHLGFPCGVGCSAVRSKMFSVSARPIAPVAIILFKWCKCLKNRPKNS